MENSESYANKIKDELYFDSRMWPPMINAEQSLALLKSKEEEIINVNYPDSYHETLTDVNYLRNILKVEMLTDLKNIVYDINKLVSIFKISYSPTATEPYESKSIENPEKKIGTPDGYILNVTILSNTELALRYNINKDLIKKIHYKSGDVVKVKDLRANYPYDNNTLSLIELLILPEPHPYLNKVLSIRLGSLRPIGAFNRTGTINFDLQYGLVDVRNISQFLRNKARKEQISTSNSKKRQRPFNSNLEKTRKKIQGKKGVNRLRTLGNIKKGKKLENIFNNVDEKSQKAEEGIKVSLGLAEEEVIEEKWNPITIDLIKKSKSIKINNINEINTFLIYFLHDILLIKDDNLTINDFIKKINDYSQTNFENKDGNYIIKDYENIFFLKEFRKYRRNKIDEIEQKIENDQQKEIDEMNNSSLDEIEILKEYILDNNYMA